MAARLFVYNHIPKNVLLIWLSLICLPFSTILIIVGSFLSKVFGGSRRSPEYEAYSPKTILVTGVSMTKGLTIARTLYRNTPHRIIGADIEPVRFAYSPGRFSKSIEKFYRLDVPDGDDTDPYVDSLLSVIHRENVDLWISCSSVVAAVEDGEVVRLAEKEMGPSFKAVQFREDSVEMLHAKDAFIDYLKSLDLPVPESHRCTSAAQVQGILAEANQEQYGVIRRCEKKRFILKPIGMDDLARNSMMTQLPLESYQATTKHLASLSVSKENPYILQQFIKGKEYCTHALVVRGRVKLFVACPSSELLMHYSALSPASKLSRAMLLFTERVAKDGGEDFTGHLSFDFLIDGEGDEFRLWPIECNPRAHTAVVLFENASEMAASYLSVFDRSIEPKTANSNPVVPRQPPYNYYWIGHDLVTLLIVPLLEFVTGYRSFLSVLRKCASFWFHFFFWKDGTFVAWDPLPFFVLYHVYWPAQFLHSILHDKRWSRINVSTTKIFAA
ncbi:hypothetical protein BU24DRAFT_441362 [Aaosphaeria arxii CBS 175.79]|uniref:ATP-grasp domain-containing protein n=1 Tax=Aaosphaeria arxii CBS 175.79 TaxID=1450172 RepID=A0A6A5XUG7_9PLEO|nr:uncharacterized protein BU24DRAFT_441362 [Aaosphaeria arxii CBS 175.79]KAF2015884.1 hypothetical protein BU24DRAFT_441362 [Aaosphaeria arxii CBS 175.79]